MRVRVGEGAGQVGPQGGLVLAGEQEAPEPETELRDDLPARCGSALPFGAVPGHADVGPCLFPEGDVRVVVPLAGAAAALLAMDEAGVQGVAEHDFEVAEGAEERGGHLAVPLVERERGLGVVGAGGRVRGEALGGEQGVHGHAGARSGR